MPDSKSDDAGGLSLGLGLFHPTTWKQNPCITLLGLGLGFGLSFGPGSALLFGLDFGPGFGFELTLQLVAESAVGVLLLLLAILVEAFSRHCCWDPSTHCGTRNVPDHGQACVASWLYPIIAGHQPNDPVADQGRAPR